MWRPNRIGPKFIVDYSHYGYHKGTWKARSTTQYGVTTHVPNQTVLDPVILNWSSETAVQLAANESAAIGGILRTPFKEHPAFLVSVSGHVSAVCQSSDLRAQAFISRYSNHATDGSVKLGWVPWVFGAGPSDGESWAFNDELVIGAFETAPLMEDQDSSTDPGYKSVEESMLVGIKWKNHGAAARQIYKAQISIVAKVYQADVDTFDPNR